MSLSGERCAKRAISALSAEMANIYELIKHNSGDKEDYELHSMLNSIHCDITSQYDLINNLYGSPLEGLIMPMKFNRTIRKIKKKGVKK